MLKVRVPLAAMESLEKHPRMVKLFLRPLANAPGLSRLLPVMFRGYMGATAFEIHDVDLAHGRIAIGGVEEIIFGAKIAELLHTVLAARMGEEETEQALYEIGLNLCKWEVGTALAGGKWAPRPLVPLIANATIIDDVRTDKVLARFFLKVMGMVSRLITDEGGWGHLEFEVESAPMRVFLSNSQEAAWLAPSAKPVCHLYAGIVAGYASAISGEDLRAREVECKAMGASHCVFEIDR